VAAVNDRILELVSELVAIQSDEIEQLAQAHLCAVLTADGFECELQEVAAGRPNLVAKRGEGGPFLCSHIDTHPPHAHPDPYTCHNVGGMLIGRGVLDAKGQIAALVAALESVPDAPALVAITCDEEGHGIGSEQIRLPDGSWRADGGIVLEPTDFRICVAQTGHIDIAVDVWGTPVHAYADEVSGSPIAAVLAAVDALETVSFLGSRHPLLPAPRLHVGRIRGGEHLWRRPAEARVEIALGLVPGVDVLDAQAEVCSRLDDLQQRWTTRGTSFTYEIADSSAPIEVDPGLPIVGRLQNLLGTGAEPAGMPSWTDAGNLLLRHGLPCVVFGAGELTTAHSDHETVAVADLVRLADVLAKLLQSYG
jgi:acetylornithine deacetylase/succinyl-diaminopimelate desuccinylase-like protein